MDSVFKRMFDVLISWDLTIMIHIRILISIFFQQYFCDPGKTIDISCGNPNACSHC